MSVANRDSLTMSSVEQVVEYLQHEMVKVPVVLETVSKLRLISTDVTCLDKVCRFLKHHLIDVYCIDLEPNSFILQLDYNCCIQCFALLGSSNPRQLCRKTYCDKM